MLRSFMTGTAAILAVAMFAGASEAKSPAKADAKTSAKTTASAPAKSESATDLSNFIASDDLVLRDAGRTVRTACGLGCSGTGRPIFGDMFDAADWQRKRRKSKSNFIWGRSSPRGLPRD